MNGKGEKTMGDTKKENDDIIEFGQAMLHADRRNTTIYLLSIIGEIEGHECLPSTSKTTKYEHVLPRLAAIEDDESVNGVLLLLNTMGGDVESGLAIAEMVASLSKPTVSLVLGGSGCKHGAQWYRFGYPYRTQVPLSGDRLRRFMLP